MDFAIVAAIALAVAGYMAGSVRVIKEGNAAVVERLGKYQRTMGAGLNFVVPLLDTVLVETTREQFIDIEPQNAMTRDRANVEVDAILFWRILDLRKAYYEVEDLDEGLKQLVITTLRSEIGQLPLEDLISSRETINRQIMLNLDRETQGWGVKIVRVEIQEIKLSEELMKARDAELAAESRRKAKESEAKAAVESIRIISDALRDSSNPKVTLQYLLAKGYIEAQQDISKSENTKIIFMDPKALTEATSEFIVAEELESGEGGMGNGR